MDSDRPQTPPPEDSSVSAEALQVVDPNKASPIVGQPSYVPSSFDLVFPTHRARDTAKLDIPPAFLQSEAVDSSLPIGSGASFDVTKLSLPPGPAELVETTDMGGWVVEKVVAAPKRPRCVVYKSARVAFQANGHPRTPRDRRALQSVLTEFHVLLHPPLLAHPNVVDFLGLAWGSNHADPAHRLPVLVVEHADAGTLADALRRAGPPLTDRAKADLCLGVARGLAALHACGVVHGDVKPENVLVFTDGAGEGALRAKLADFGFAVVEDAEPSEEVVVGGTRTWCAPEAFSPVGADRLRLTDVYSFGLVAWSIAADGQDPFGLVLPYGLTAQERGERIQELKESDQVLELSKMETWILKSVIARNPMLSQLLASARPLIPGSGNGLDIMGLFHNAQLPPEVQQQVQQLGDLMSRFLDSTRKQLLYKDLDEIFSLTLTREPSRRDLGAVIRLLEGKKDADLASDLSKLAVEERQVEPVASNDVEVTQDSNPKSETHYRITNNSSEERHFKFTQVKPNIAHSQLVEQINSASEGSKIDWSMLGFKHRRYSWQMTRDLEPSLQSFVVKSLLHLDDAASRFPLAAFLLNGYGLPSDPDHALRCLSEAARDGHGLAQAYLPRIANALQKEIASDIPVLEYLENQAIRGSRMALQELKRLAPGQGSHCQRRIRFGYGGVGANWFTDGQMRLGLTQSTLMSKDFSPESLGPPAELPGLEVNQKGDNLLHAAASVGALGLLRELLASTHFDVNGPNKAGETALLCACRSGHADIVKVLLDNGARASIPSRTGETPLHWLSSFDESINIQLLGEDLMTRGGAEVDAYTTRRTAHSVFPGSIDVDFQVEGTPLLWAVHDDQPRIVSFLLSKGADPNWRLRKDTSSPIEWAAFYHHTECLELIITHLEQTASVPVTTTGERDLRHAVVYHPLVQKAIHAADKFSMILRNGAGYLDRLRSTLALLQAKTQRVRFTLGHGETLLHLAARGAHDEACEVLLDLGWRADELDAPAGATGRTPLLESVRWNRRALFQRLLAAGADPRALSAAPHDDTGARTWTALHLLADQAHDDDLGLVDDLVVRAGLAVDGPPPPPGDGDGAARAEETPLCVAVRRGAFRLADRLAALGADVDAPHARSALLAAPRPLTGLGHAVALNARCGLPALRYLLARGAAFVVEPARGLTALHVAALVPDGFAYVGAGGGAVARGGFDWETNGVLAGELLQWFGAPGLVDQRCGWGRRTALHVAAECGNVGVVERLVRAGASRELRDEKGETAVEIARRRWTGEGDTDVLSRMLEWLE